MQAPYCNIQKHFPHASETTQNTDFTTRGVKELEDTQEVALGSYQDAAPIVTSSVNSQVIQSPYSGFNLETFDLSEILNREYPISTFTWSTSQAAYTSLGFQDFPSALFTQSFIADKIKNFRGFRGGIRVTARVTSANVNYGSIIMAFVPDTASDPYNGGRISSLDRLSGFPHVILSASQSNTAVLDIPFIYSQRYIDLLNYTAGCLGRVYYRVFNPLTNVFGDITDVEVFTTAQFVEAEVMIPFSPQSNPQRSKAAAVQSAKSRRISRPNHEAYQKASSGVISGTLESMDDLIGSLSTIPFVAPLAGLYDAFSKPAQGLLKIAGLDKPTSLARTDVVKYNPYSDIANARGIDTCAKLAVDPENGITTQPVVGGVTHDEMDLTYIAGTPVLLNTQTFGVASAIGSQVEIFTSDLTQNEWSYPHFLVGLARWYSGSPKIKVYITASNFHSARIVFYYSNTNTSWQNCYHRVVDIQGDTEVDMTLPYTSSFPVSGTGVVNPMKLYAVLLSYSQADPTLNTPIYLNTYFAMASDFRMYGPMNIMVNSTFTPQSNPRLDFQKNFEGIHPSVTGYKQENMVCGEEITSYRDLVHRYSTIRRIQCNTEFSRYEGRGNCTSTGFAGLEKLGLIFRFHRGSCRFKMIQRDNKYRGVIHYPPGSVPGTGPLFEGTTFSSMINPVLEFELPYYSNVLYEENTVDSSHKFMVVGTTAAPDDRVLMLKAGGDDFSFHFLCPPPPLDTPAVNGYGNIAIKTFLDEQAPFNTQTTVLTNPLPVQVTNVPLPVDVAP